MIKTFFSLLLFIAISLNSFAQENFLAGYYVNNEGDTIKGLIDYRNWSKNPENFVFKTSLNTAEIKLGMNEAKAFSVSGEIFVNAVIETKISNSAKEQTNNPFPKIQVINAFVQLLIDGNKNLYFYKDSNGIENFYYLENGNYKLLIFEKYILEEGENHYLRENNKFKGQLNAYLSDCESINSRTENLNYSRTSIKHVYNHYYDCISSTPSYIQKNEKWKMKIGASFGLVNSKISFSGTIKDYLTKADFQATNNIMLGLSSQFIQPRNRNRISFVNSVYFTMINESAVYQEYSNPDIYSITSTELGFVVINTNHLIRYTKSLGNFHLYGNVGLNIGVHFPVKNHITIEKVVYSSSNTTEDYAIDYLKKVNLGILGGVGLMYKNWGVEGRYVTGNSISNYITLTSKVKRLEVLVSYWF